MRTLTFITLLLSITGAFAQTKVSDKVLDSIPKVSGSYGYEKVVTVDSSLSKDKLYNLAKLYFVNNYKNANAVIQLDDKEQGRVIGKGLFKISDSQGGLVAFSLSWNVNYTTEVTCKNGRYRYRLYDISITQHGPAANWDKDITIPDAQYMATHGALKKLYTKLLNSMKIGLDGEASSLSEIVKMAKSDDF